MKTVKCVKPFCTFSFTNYRLFRKNGGQKLRHLDLSGCSKITDRTLKKLTLALTPRTDCVGQNASVEGDKQSRSDELISSSRGLRYLSLSGCFHITDDGIRFDDFFCQ